MNSLASFCLFTPALLRRLTGSAACLGLLSASLTSQAAEITPTTLRLAHVVNTEDTYHIAAARFQELVSEKTDGAVTVDIYPNASLGDERTLLEGMQIGTVDMGVITNGPVANFVDEFSIFELATDLEAFQATVAPVYEKYGQQFGDYLPRIQEALQ